MNTLYIVSTPIGNLEDISARALRILQEVKLIAAEDTRRTKKLLDRYEIKTPLTSYYDHNKGYKLQHVMTALEEGDLALVSDAGTPGLNDPGYRLVREALDAGHKVCPIPGPSAPIAALVVSGLPTDQFLYLGYLPRNQNERKKFIEEISSEPYTLILFESPHRLQAAISDLFEILGDRGVSVACEMTKMYEDYFRGTLNGAQEYFQHEPIRGEYTLVVAGKTLSDRPWEEEQLRLALIDALAGEQTSTQIARDIAKISHWPRRKVYDLLVSLQSGKNRSGTN